MLLSTGSCYAYGANDSAEVTLRGTNDMDGHMLGMPQVIVSGSLEVSNNVHMIALQS